MTAAPVREHDVHTPDGGSLQVLESGSLDGRPVLIHHGMPGSSGPYEPWVEDARDRGIRLVSYDRPGYGSSSPHPDRSGHLTLMTRRIPEVHPWLLAQPGW